MFMLFMQTWLVGSPLPTRLLKSVHAGSSVSTTNDHSPADDYHPICLQVFIRSMILLSMNSKRLNRHPSMFLHRSQARVSGPEVPARLLQPVHPGSSVSQANDHSCPDNHPVCLQVLELSLV